VQYRREHEGAWPSGAAWFSPNARPPLVLDTDAIVAEIPDKESGGGGGGVPDMSGMM
jgi:hypothetical protein